MWQLSLCCKQLVDDQLRLPDETRECFPVGLNGDHCKSTGNSTVNINCLNTQFNSWCWTLVLNSSYIHDCMSSRVVLHLKTSRSRPSLRTRRSLRLQPPSLIYIVVLSSLRTASVIVSDRDRTTADRKAKYPRLHRHWSTAAARRPQRRWSPQQVWAGKISRWLPRQHSSEREYTWNVQVVCASYSMSL